MAPGSQAPGNIINPADIITFWDVLLPRWRELRAAWKCSSIAFTELGFHMIRNERNLLIVQRASITATIMIQQHTHYFSLECDFPVSPKEVLKFGGVTRILKYYVTKREI